MSKPLVRCLLVTSALALSSPAWAEVDSAYEAPAIVVNGERESEAISATKTGTPLRDTPQSVTTIGRQQLDEQAVEQLNDALRYVPGVTLGQGEGHRDQIVIRGQATTADFFLDGVRDDAQYYRPLYNTERVEVLKGANALLFGRGGGGGVVNRVSKAPAFDNSRGTATASADSFGAWSLAGDANFALSGAAALRLNATYEELANHRDQFGGHFIGLAPTARLRLGEATTLTLAYEYAGDRRLTDRGAPAEPGGTLLSPARPIAGFTDTFFGDPAINRSKVDAHIVRMRLDHELAEGLSLQLIGQYAHYDKYYGNVLPGAVNSARTLVSLSGYRSTTERANWIGQANLVWKGETGSLRHTLLAGVEASDQDTLASRDDARFGAATSVNVPLVPRITVPALTWTVTSASHSDVRALSAYVQDQIEIGDHLQLIAGARYDDFRIEATNLLPGGLTTGRSDGKWSPRLGVVIKPVPALSLYASYAKSFLPQTGDQFTTLAANVAILVPEEFRNLEAGVKWDLAPDLAFTAAVFQLDRSNTRLADPANSGFFLVSGKSRVRGVEASLSGKLTPDWQMTLGYAYQNGEIRSPITSGTTPIPADRKLDKLPQHQISAWTRYDMTGGIGIGLGLVHQSSQFATISNAVKLPAFTRIDAALFFDVSDNLAVQFNVENLTDATYFPSAHTDNNIATGEPLNARMTVRLKF